MSTQERTVPIRRVAPGRHGTPSYKDFTEKKLAAKYAREDAQAIANGQHLNFLIEMGFIEAAKELLKQIEEF